MARIILFPAERVVRHPDLIETLEKLAMLDEYESSGDRIKQAVAVPMREHYEAEFRRLGGVPADLLRRDGLAEEA